jgi:exo-beta-1,3-glucanase (GH17 family)
MVEPIDNKEQKRYSAFDSQSLNGRLSIMRTTSRAKLTAASPRISRPSALHKKKACSPSMATINQQDTRQRTPHELECETIDNLTSYYLRTQDVEKKVEPEPILSAERNLGPETVPLGSPMSSSAAINSFCALRDEIIRDTQSVRESADSSKFEQQPHETECMLAQIEDMTEDDKVEESRKMHRGTTWTVSKSSNAPLSPIDLLPSHLSKPSTAEIHQGPSYNVNRITSMRDVSGGEQTDGFAQNRSNFEKVPSPDEVDRYILVDSLIEGGVTDRPQNELDLIKGNLSRSKSTTSDYSIGLSRLHGEVPLLFSQTSIPHKNEPDAPDDHNRQYLNPFESTADELLDEGDKDDQLSEVEEGASNEFNLLTTETELNCIKKQKSQGAKEPEKKARYPSRIYFMTRWKSSSSPFWPFYRAEDPSLNVLTGEAKRGFLNDKLKDFDPESHSIIKSASLRRNTIIMWILFVLLMAAICIFVPLLVVYLRGSDSAVTKYLNHISPDHRNHLLSPFVLGNPSSGHPKESTSVMKRPQKINPLEAKPGATIAGITYFSDIPMRYQRVPEIRDLMTNHNLSNVFYGIDYAPRNVIYPACGATQKDVMLDVALLSQVTSRIRTYGTQCNQTKYILESIKLLHLNVSLSIGVWIGENDEINDEQILDMKQVFRSYPRKYFETIFVGNEVLFREDQSSEKLIKYIDDVKSFVQKELKWDIPVGTSELSSRVDANVMKHCDFFGSNTHPFFSGESVSNASAWTFDSLKYQVEPYRKLSSTRQNSPRVILSEVGWPYDGGSYHNAKAGPKEMQEFINDFVCKANEQKRPWYFFEAFDEPWKEVYHRNNARWETEWGLFTADRKMKQGITFPQC